MSKSVKLGLDILIGAVAPVVILKYGTASLGTLPAYLLAALVPVAWVMLDLLVLTRPVAALRLRVPRRDQCQACARDGAEARFVKSHSVFVSS